MSNLTKMLQRLAALISLAVVLTIVLTACGTTRITGSRGVACTSLPPAISFSYDTKVVETFDNVLDTKKTVEQVRNYNARIRAICEEKE